MPGQDGFGGVGHGWRRGNAGGLRGVSRVSGGGRCLGRGREPDVGSTGDVQVVPSFRSPVPCRSPQTTWLSIIRGLPACPAGRRDVEQVPEHVRASPPGEAAPIVVRLSNRRDRSPPDNPVLVIYGFIPPRYRGRRGWAVDGSLADRRGRCESRPRGVGIDTDPRLFRPHLSDRRPPRSKAPLSVPPSRIQAGRGRGRSVRSRRALGRSPRSGSGRNCASGPRRSPIPRPPRDPRGGPAASSPTR